MSVYSNSFATILAKFILRSGVVVVSIIVEKTEGQRDK